MNTLTATDALLRPPATALAAALAAFRRRWVGTQASAAETAAELLARADRYQATQPSYAADLRAAARRLADGC